METKVGAVIDGLVECFPLARCSCCRLLPCLFFLHSTIVSVLFDPVESVRAYSFLSDLARP